MNEGYEDFLRYRRTDFWKMNNPNVPWTNPYDAWYTKESKTQIKGHTEDREQQTCTCRHARKDVRDYLSVSTLHGLRYLGDGKLTWFERSFWLVAVILSFVCASFFILNVYDKWSRSPMIVTINPESMPLAALPFPAITVCNVNQAKKSVADKIRSDKNESEHAQWDRKLLRSLCNSDSEMALFEDGAASQANWEYFRTFLIRVTQPCTEMLQSCEWRFESRQCSELFNAQLTDEGLCCTFNAVHRDFMFRNPNEVSDLNITYPFQPVNWTAENGYPEDSPDEAFPWRPAGTGVRQGLTLVLDAAVDEYYCATTSSVGFKIHMHNPTETPKISEFGDLYPPGVEARVSIIPKIFDANPRLASIDVRKRHCVFSSERSLVFFRTYTEKNCQMECQSRLMLDECNCVLYYMPKNRTTRVCGKADAYCYAKFLISLDVALGPRADCGCLPACAELAYVERVSVAPLRERLLNETLLGNRTARYFKENMLVVHFFFEESSFVRYTKGEIFGLTEFLSNTGGLLGLCMGFSMMSAVELLYFLSLRALCLARRRRRVRGNR